MKRSKIIMIVGSLLLLSLFVMPMWNITLKAPQYPDAIGMNIWINKITDMNPNDIKNINLMNHYVGMKEIPEHMKEFEVFPIVIGVMAALGVIIGITGRKELYLVWFITMVILGTIGMYDFYLWEYEYGHNLDPKAAIKIPGQGYQPPLIGVKQILNFTAISKPLMGAYLMFLGMFLSVYAFWYERKQERSHERNN